MKLLEIISYEPLSVKEELLSTTTISNKQIVMEAAGSSVSDVVEITLGGEPAWRVLFTNERGRIEELIFTNTRDAEAAIDAFDPDDTTAWKNRVRQDFGGNVRTDSIMDRYRLSRDIDERTARRANQNLYARFMNNWLFKTFMRFGIGVEIIWSLIVNIQEVEDSNLDAEQKEEAKRMLASAAMSQFVLDLVAAFAARKLLRILRYLRTVVRAAGGLQMMSGVGFFTGALSLIFGEVAFWAVRAIVASPAVQRALADWMASTMFADVFEFFGAAALTAGRYLDGIVSPLLGGRSIRDSLFRENPLEAPQGTSYASSEWAKLTFNFTIFGKKGRVKVPYTPRGVRGAEIFEALGLEPAQEGTPSNPRPIPSGQAGMMSDYVFEYSLEEYNRLRDTHEVVVLNDVGGAIPGGSNQILLLAPTQEALTSGEPIPMPDNRIITRSGQLIDRGEGEQPADGVDDIVQRAQAAIDRADAGIGTSTGTSDSPVQPVGRMSSSRPRGVQGNVRPGDETNALDAFAADATP